MSVKKTLILILSFCFSMLAFVQEELGGKDIENRSTVQDRAKKLNTDDAKFNQYSHERPTIVMIDYVLSGEGGGLFINFNHIF